MNDLNDAIGHPTDATFEAEVLSSPVPVLVDYWAEWCGPCRMVGPLVDELGEAYAGRLKVVKINTDENPHVPSRYHVRSIPTLMLFRDGVPVATQVGALNRSQLAAFVESHLR
ncbi:MAG TPA: thioredoxin [Gammaproteobacteria bacterium]|nr:thioredoxin [Gammaproteobacteria bacterium]